MLLFFEATHMELKISFANRDEFVKEWEKNITKGGIFVKSSSNPPPRSRVSVSVEMKFVDLSFEIEGEAVHVTPAGIGVQLDPIPDVIKEDIRKLLAGEAERPSATEDDEFELALEEDEESAPEVVSPETPAPAAEQKTAESAEAAKAEAEKPGAMSRNEKMSQARKGGMDTRAVLMRDRDPQVLMNVLMNPRITIAEVIQISGSTSIKLDHVKYIVSRADWMATEAVCLNIVLNPKTPTPTAVSYLSKLSEKNLRMIAKRPLKQQVKAAALKMVVK